MSNSISLRRRRGPHSQRRRLRRIPTKSLAVVTMPLRPTQSILSGRGFARRITNPNHVRLAGRLSVDDPEGLEATYPVQRREHGTEMASLIIHGDLSAGRPRCDVGFMCGLS
jgi:hypothetical protein